MTNNVAVSVASCRERSCGLFVEVGTPVRAGDVLALVESMKMHHEVVAPVAGVVDVGRRRGGGNDCRSARSWFASREGVATEMPDG